MIRGRRRVRQRLCAETFARIAAERKWVIAVYLITVFIALPALIIVLVGVL